MSGAIAAARAELQRAEAHVEAACNHLRRTGLPENGDILAVELDRLRIWSGPQGWLTHLEAKDDG